MFIKSEKSIGIYSKSNRCNKEYPVCLNRLGMRDLVIGIYKNITEKKADQHAVK